MSYFIVEMVDGTEFRFDREEKFYAVDGTPITFEQAVLAVWRGSPFIGELVRVSKTGSEVWMAGVEEECLGLFRPPYGVLATHPPDLLLAIAKKHHEEIGRFI